MDLSLHTPRSQQWGIGMKYMTGQWQSIALALPGVPIRAMGDTTEITSVFLKFTGRSADMIPATFSPPHR
jgi:hypothetical protein